MDDCRERGPSIHPSSISSLRTCFSARAIACSGPFSPMASHAFPSAPTSPAAAAKVPVHDPTAGDSVEAHGPWRGGDGGAGTRPTDLTRLDRVLLRAIPSLKLCLVSFPADFQCVMSCLQRL